MPTKYPHAVSSLSAFWPQHLVVHDVDEHQEGGSVEIHNHREKERGASLESAGRRLASSFVVAKVFNRSVREIIVIKTIIER